MNKAPISLRSFDDVLSLLRLEPSAAPSAQLAAAVQLWPTAQALDSSLVPHRAVPALVLRWVVAPYVAVTVGGVGLSPAVCRGALSAEDLPPGTRALCPTSVPPLVPMLPAGVPTMTLALESGKDAPTYEGESGSGNSDEEDLDISVVSSRTALCVVDAAALLDVFLAHTLLRDEAGAARELVLPISPDLVHDVVCVNVDDDRRFAEAVTLQLAAAVACKLRATAVSFSGNATTFVTDCLGKQKKNHHPPVVDMSGLHALRKLLPNGVDSPWPKTHRLVLPPLSPDGHASNAHFNMAPLSELVVGTPRRPSRLHHLGNNGFCFAKDLRCLDLRPCPELRSIGSLVFQGSTSLRTVCLRGLKKLQSFGDEPFFACDSLALLDLRDASLPQQVHRVFQKAARTIVLISPTADSERFQRKLTAASAATRRDVLPGTESQYPPGALVPNTNKGGAMLHVALTEAQYKGLPASAPVHTGVHCLCSFNPHERLGDLHRCPGVLPCLIS